jgi:hypothetical protein
MNSSGWKDIAELIGLGAIVLSLVLVAYELRQNTRMMRAQTRDSLTEKQMMFSDWIGTNEYAANVSLLGAQGKLEPGTPDHLAFRFLIHGVFREWENSFYQFEQGLFDQDEFEPRKYRWTKNMRLQGYQDYWASGREAFSPRFRAEIDKIVSEIQSKSSPE